MPNTGDRLACRSQPGISQWGERLGTVVAKDQDAALKAAIKSFMLPREEHDRLLVRPR
jgi:hypothetical protein